RKFKDEESSKITEANHLKDINKNYLNENEIYEKIDPDTHRELLEIIKAKKEFFERLKCRLGNPFNLATETHFRTYKEARILTRGDRDIIIKRLTEESRRIIPYNMNFLKTFRCNHDIQIITDAWASAEYLFSYVAKNAHMEKNLVYQISNCTCTSLKEAKSILLKIGNAVLSHREVGKVEASWTVLEPLVENPLWRNGFEQPPLLKTSALLPRIILSCGTVLIQHKEPACISFTGRYDDSMLAIYSILSIGIPYRDPVEEFLAGKQENDVKAIHQLLLKNQTTLIKQFSTLPGAYKVQMPNALEHLCDLNSHDFIIKPRTSFIFTGEDDEDLENETNENNNRINDKININCESDLNINTELESIDENDEEHLSQNEDVGINTASTRTEELLKLANEQQRFLTNFFEAISSSHYAI
ncbi:unnamed protein product, partial [Adineta steineri]